MRRHTCANVDACMKSWFDWHSNSVSLLLPDVITTNIISIKREVVFWKVFNLCMCKSSTVLCTAKFRTRKCEQYLGYVGYLGYLGYLGYQGSNSSCKNSGLSLSLVKMQAEECSRGGGMWHVTIPNANASTYVSQSQMQMQAHTCHISKCKCNAHTCPSPKCKCNAQACHISKCKYKHKHRPRRSRPMLFSLYHFS